MRRLLAVLLLAAACKDTAAPTFGTIAVRTAASCASGEDVQVWVGGSDVSGGRLTIPYPGELSVPNVPTGLHSVDVFRWRYSTEGNLHVTVKTGAVSSVRLDCPDGYTIVEP